LFLFKSVHYITSSLVFQALRNHNVAMSREKKSRPQIPKSWTEAAGLLRNKKKALELHVKKVRREWA